MTDHPLRRTVQAVEERAGRKLSHVELQGVEIAREQALRGKQGARLALAHLTTGNTGDTPDELVEAALAHYDLAEL